MSKITQSTLDRRLTDVLRGLVSHAPMPDALLQVPDAWVRGRRLLRSSGQAAAVGGVVTLAAVTTLAVLAFVGALGERGPSVGSEDPPADVGVPIEALDLEPRPGQIRGWYGAEPAIGPVMDVARGRVAGKDFQFTVYRAEPSIEAELGLVCVILEWLPDPNVACGAMPGEPRTIGEVFGLGSDTHAYGSSVVHGFFGLVAQHVAEVRIETDAGSRAQARLIPLDAAGVDAQLFIAFLPGGVDSSAWVALDADGTEIGRIETSPGPPEVPGPVPTPAAAP
jgi:hypothetical protein